MSEAEGESNTEPDTERARIQSYVPKYQKEIWRTDAEEMDMSLSEFVRCMTQAGRRGFDTTTVQSEQNGPATGVDEETLRKRALAMLSEVEPLTFDEMHTLLVSGLETTLDDALVSLQSDGELIRGRDGYRLTDDAEVST